MKYFSILIKINKQHRVLIAFLDNHKIVSTFFPIFTEAVDGNVFDYFTLGKILILFKLLHFARVREVENKV